MWSEDVIEPVGKKTKRKRKFHRLERYDWNTFIRNFIKYESKF